MKEDINIQPEVTTILFTVGEGAYLDNVKVHVTNNDDHGNASTFHLIIHPEVHWLNMPDSMSLEPSKTGTIILDTKLKEGTQLLLRTSSVNLTAKVEGNIVQDFVLDYNWSDNND